MAPVGRRLFFGTTRDAVYAAILGAALLVAYGPTLVEMAREWFNRPEYGHGVLMPPVAAWMIWSRRRELAALRRRQSGALLTLAGALAFVPLGLLLLLGEMKLSWFLKPFSFIAALVASVAILYGWQGLKALGKPLFVLALMCPIPWRILIWITLPLKRHASVLATGLIDLSGLDASLEGNLIHVPGISSLWIVDGCSGVRSLISLMSVAVLGCLFWKRHWLVKLAVLASCAPIAVAVNGTRIWLTAVLAKHVSAAAAEGFFHNFQGFALFGAAALVLLLWALLLNRLVPRREVATGAANAVLRARPEPPILPDRPRVRGLAVALTSLLLLLSAAGVYQIRASLDEARTNEAAVARMQKAFSALPLEIAGGIYRGKVLEIDAKAVAASGADAYRSVHYRDSQGRSYQVYIGGALRNADNFHAPNVCMPTAGWEMIEKVGMPLWVYADADASPQMQRLVLQRGNERMLTYFWFQAGDRLAADEWAVRFYRLRDLLRGEPLSPTLIVSVYVPIEENVSEAEVAAQQFLGAIAPYLREVTTSGGIHG